LDKRRTVVDNEVEIRLERAERAWKDVAVVRPNWASLGGGDQERYILYWLPKALGSFDQLIEWRAKLTPDQEQRLRAIEPLVEANRSWVESLA
jgi:hypothetical protein